MISGVKQQFQSLSQCTSILNTVHNYWAAGNTRSAVSSIKEVTRHLLEIQPMPALSRLRTTLSDIERRLEGFQSYPSRASRTIVDQELKRSINSALSQISEIGRELKARESKSLEGTSVEREQDELNHETARKLIYR